MDKKHELPQLPYHYNALEPHIDEATMRLHHSKHHAAYVSNLNAALEKYPDLLKKTPEQLIANLEEIPEDIRTAVRNNGGGHVNHAMFWQIMSPKGGGEPTGALAQKIKESFGSFENFKEQFQSEGVKRFGSGWVWLVRTKEGHLNVLSTPNQDNPMSQGHFPILGNDVWEHAYYLNYKNMRADYLKAWWNVVDWEAVGSRLL